jgi:threonine/homoserine efflux transporter RhtA
MSKSLLFLGLFILTIFAGAQWSIKLVKYGYFVLIFGVLLLIYFLYATLVDQKPTRATKIVGSLCGIALVLFLGIQSPQLPLKMPVIVVGGSLTAIAGFLMWYRS